MNLQNIHMNSNLVLIITNLIINLVDVLVVLLPVLLSIIGSVLALYLYQIKPQFIVDLTANNLGKKFYTFLNGKYFFDIIYNHYIIRKSLNCGYYISNLLERGIIEFIGPYGLSNVLFNSGKNISKLDTGIVTSYALYIVLGLISLIFIIFIPTFFEINNNFIFANSIFEIRLIIIYISSFVLYTILGNHSK